MAKESRCASRDFSSLGAIYPLGYIGHRFVFLIAKVKIVRKFKKRTKGIDKM
ncbi:hypothetical protein ACFLVV_01480 [Chloroflexota bacterium]